MNLYLERPLAFTLPPHRERQKGACSECTDLFEIDTTWLAAPLNSTALHGTSTKKALSVACERLVLNRCEYTLYRYGNNLKLLIITSGLISQPEVVIV